MKTATDPRHKRRIALMKKLFAASFPRTQKRRDKAGSIRELKRVDREIQNAAPEWPIDKIAKIDLAILRVAVYELAVAKKEPPKVVIDEAVELAKEFGNESSPKFVNGVLGTILKTI